MKIVTTLKSDRTFVYDSSVPNEKILSDMNEAGETIAEVSETSDSFEMQVNVTVKYYGNASDISEQF